MLTTFLVFIWLALLIYFVYALANVIAPLNLKFHEHVWLTTRKQAVVHSIVALCAFLVFSAVVGNIIS